MRDRTSSWVAVLFISFLAFGCLVAPRTHAECDSGLSVIDGPECLPVTRGDTLAVIVDVDNQSARLSTIKASLVERIAVQALTNGLRAPPKGRRQPRSDIEIVSHAVEELAKFTWSPATPEHLTTALVQCSVRDVQVRELPTAVGSITCQMTAGKMKLESGWMTGYQIRNTRAVAALLTGRNDVDQSILTTLVRQLFAKMIDASRTPQ